MDIRPSRHNIYVVIQRWRTMKLYILSISVIPVPIVHRRSTSYYSLFEFSLFWISSFCFAQVVIILIVVTDIIFSSSSSTLLLLSITPATATGVDDSNFCKTSGSLHSKK